MHVALLRVAFCGTGLRRSVGLVSSIRGPRVALLDTEDLDAADLACWRALAAVAVGANPFFEPEIALPAIRHLRGSSRPRLLVVAAGGDWQLVLPVRLGAGGFAISTWRHPYCFYGMPLVASSTCDEALRTLVEWLHTKRWTSLLLLSRVPVSAPPLDTLTSALRGRGRSTVWVGVVDRPVLSVGAEDARPRPSRNLRERRSELRRHAGALRVARAQAPDDPDVFRGVEKFIELEASGWKGTAGTAIVQHPAHLSFLWEMVDGLHKAGRLQVWGLFAGELCVAVQINIVVGSTVFAFKAAYDGTLYRFSPGTVLLAEILDQLREDPAVQLVDSLTLGENATVNRLFTGRLRIGTLAAATGGRGSDAFARCVPAGLACRAKLLGRSRAVSGEAPITGRWNAGRGS